MNELASDGRGYYNSDWHGPPIGQRTTDGLLASTGALVGAIGPDIPNASASKTKSVNCASC
jgi:hypothetical protein